MSKQSCIDYWRDRCLAAEDFIDNSPGDPDVTAKQTIAYMLWLKLRETRPPKIKGCEDVSAG